LAFLLIGYASHAMDTAKMIARATDAPSFAADSTDSRAVDEENEDDDDEVVAAVVVAARRQPPRLLVT
jgi:hypothetical protein